jgi:hypothetical protein
MKNRLTILSASFLSLAVIAALGSTQSVTPHPTSWLKIPTGHLYFALDNDGTRLLVNRGGPGGLEEWS